MLYVLTPNGVVTGKTLGQVNKKLNAKLEESEFSQLGSDKIVRMETQDIDFVQDKKRLSIIPISNLYKSDGSMKYMLLGMLFLQFFLLVKK